MDQKYVKLTKRNGSIAVAAMALFLVIAMMAPLFGQAKFEPPAGKVLMIVGQDMDAVGGMGAPNNKGYIEEVIGGDKAIFPAGITTYTDLQFNLGIWQPVDYGAGPLHAHAYLHDDDFKNSVIAIGMDLTNGQLANAANGGLDQQIVSIAGWIKNEAKRPVFLRPGFEFNGQWNKYSSTDFVKAWKRIYDIFKREGVTNCAFVWQSCDNSEPGNDLNAYYPGDEYVDWCGFTLFWGDGKNMIEFAKAHKKPIFIAEACAKGRKTSDGQSGQQHWDAWYKKMVDLVNNNKDVVKAVGYINQDWNKQPHWANSGFDWGNSRIQDNADLKNLWVTEMKKSLWMHASDDLFNTLNNPGNKVISEFASDHMRCYKGESLNFEDKSMGKVSKWEWNFGDGASPATATGEGPHKVSYNSAGKKTVTLKVTGPENDDTETKTEYALVEEVPASTLIMNEQFKNASSVGKKFNGPYHPKDPDSTYSWVYSHSGGEHFVSTCPKGHGEWDGFYYYMNDGSNAQAINFNHPKVKPVVTVRVRKKPISPTINHLALLRIDVIDKYDIATDSLMPNKFPLTEDFQEFTFDFTDKMVNKYGTSFVGFGPLDDRNIKAIKFQINSGWYSYPDTINGVAYNSYYQGDIEFDWIKVGIPDNVVLSNFTASPTSIDTGGSVTFTDASTGTITGYEWNFGDGASPATANTKGPHTVKYTKAGKKTVSLKVTGANGTHTEKKDDYINVMMGGGDHFSDLFNDNVLKDKFIKEVITPPRKIAVYNFSEKDQALNVECPTGHGEWDYVQMDLYEGDAAATFDISDDTKQKLYIRMKSTVDAVIRVSLVDAEGVEVGNDEISDGTNGFNCVVGTDWKDFVIDYKGRLNGTWFSAGPLDATKIAKINMRPNPGFVSFPWGGHDKAFTGTLYVDHISLGSPVAIHQQAATIAAKSATIALNPQNKRLMVNLGSADPKNVSLMVYNLRGQQMLHKAKGMLKGKAVTFDLNGFSSGIYMVRLKINTQIISQTILLNK